MIHLHLYCHLSITGDHYREISLYSYYSDPSTQNVSLDSTMHTCHNIMDGWHNNITDIMLGGALQYIDLVNSEVGGSEVVAPL